VTIANAVSWSSATLISDGQQSSLCVVEGVYSNTTQFNSTSHPVSVNSDLNDATRCWVEWCHGGRNKHSFCDWINKVYNKMLYI